MSLALLLICSLSLCSVVPLTAKCHASRAPAGQLTLPGTATERVAVKVIKLGGAGGDAMLKAAMSEVTVMCRVMQSMGAEAVALRGFVHRPGVAFMIVMQLALGSVFDRMQLNGGRLDLRDAVRARGRC